jgi:hypothetical protein
MNMELWQIIVIVAVVIVAFGIGAWVVMRQRRTQELSGRFGPEYRETIEQTGDQRAAERELEQRQKRVSEMEIHPLTADEQERFSAEWQSVQAQFVDDPSGAISQADRLVQTVMGARGYEVGEDFERRAADVSVDHPQVVSEYRAAHKIAMQHAEEGVGTEELRQAMVHYRALFAELLEAEDRAAVEAGE